MTVFLWTLWKDLIGSLSKVPLVHVACVQYSCGPFGHILCGSLSIVPLVLGVCLLFTITVVMCTLWQLLIGLDRSLESRSSCFPLYIGNQWQQCSISYVPSCVFSFQDFALKTFALLLEDFSCLLSFSLSSHVLDIVVRIPTCLDFFGCVVVEAHDSSCHCSWRWGKTDSLYFFFFFVLQSL